LRDYRLAQLQAPLGETGSDRLRFTSCRQAPGPRTESSLLRVRLADPTLPPSTNLYRPPSRAFYRLAHPFQLPGTVTVPYQLLISHLFSDYPTLP